MKFYERYWKNQKDYLSDFSLKWPKLREFIPLENNIVIVDFGCGNGKILEEIKKINPTAKLFGFDVSETAINLAKKNLLDVEFFKINDGEKIPINNATVDFIFSSEVFEHIYDIENVFSEISRILKQNGKLLLTIPYHGFIKNLLITFFAFNKHFNPVGSHIRFFTKKSLFGLLEKHGFKIKRYGYYGRFYPISHSIYVLADKK